jgi:hypothetical protein
MEIDGGPLGDSFEDHLTVPDLTAPVTKWEWVNAAHRSAITKDLAVRLDLHEERPSPLIGTVFVLLVLDEENPSFVIELDFAINKIGSCHLNRLASGFLRNHVDCLLRKGVP